MSRTVVGRICSISKKIAFEVRCLGGDDVLMLVGVVMVVVGFGCEAKSLS